MPFYSMSSRLLALAKRSAPTPSNNMTVVQALRGIAAFWVVLFHAAQGHHVDALLGVLPSAIRMPMFEWGHYGVAIFFALSGFVIAHSLRDAHVDGRYFGKFLLRRSVRLDPPYWGAILLCIALSLVSAKVKHEGADLPALSTIAAHFVYLQELLQKPEINSAFWTLTYEVQFYLISCFSLLLINYGKFRGWDGSRYGILSVLFCSAAWSATGFYTLAVPGLFLNLWFAFFVGTLAYWSLAKPGFRIPFAALLCVILMSHGRSDFYFGVCSALSAVLLFFAAVTGWIDRGLRSRWLQFFGLISYSLYLLHNPITGVSGFVIRAIFGNGLFANCVSLLVIVGSTVIAASMYFYAVERPVHRWSRRVMPSRTLRPESRNTPRTR